MPSRRNAIVKLCVASLASLVALAAGTVASSAAPTGAPDVQGQHHIAAAWSPRFWPAVHWAEHRQADAIAFAVCTRTRCWRWHAFDTFHSASLLKPILLVAYLNQPSVRSRHLTSSEKSLLTPMIEVSDNDAATTVLHDVGASAVYGVASSAGMREFRLVYYPWGLTYIDADDQARFFLHIDQLIPPIHRAFAMNLLASITSSQRWGVGQISPRGWRLYFKGGWGSGTGWVDHQSALLVRGPGRVSLSILTSIDPSHPYGKQTLQGIAARLLHGLPGARYVP